ncbi:MAG: HYR domain-containing protein, partial [Ignavibacteriae bacterium]|nr:HYR domain-containing protein [Ignavibacteriota bacterium]
TPASGSVFPIGTTTVNCTATNNSGSASCSFTVTVTPLGIAPTLTCPANIVTNNNPGTGGAVVNYTVTSTGDPAPSVTCTPASGSVFPIGTTTVNCTATNANGSVSCSFTVTVIDNEPPSITCSVNPASLWPPNHKMKDISASFTASDNSGTATVVLTSITCSEPDNGLGDGDTPDDIQDASYGTADTQFKLRAERSGRGNGRVYTITYSATDASGNSSTCVSTVTVPHNPGSKTEIGPEEMSKAPEEFALHGNYPNPFNPSTVISYSLPVNGVVTLKVFNTLGEEVATLLNNEELESGNYEAIFTAESLPSGIYFYRINVESVDEDGVKNSFTDVKRLTLLK